MDNGEERQVTSGEILKQLEWIRENQFMVSKKAFAHALLSKPGKPSRNCYLTYHKWHESPHGLDKIRESTRKMLHDRISLLTHISHSHNWTPNNEPLKMMKPGERNNLFVATVNQYLMALAAPPTLSAH